MKKNQIFAKTFHLLVSIRTLFFKLPQILSLIQVFASSVKQHAYNNLTFEVHTNKGLKIMYPKKIIIFIKSSTCRSFYIKSPQYFVTYIILCIFYHVFTPKGKERPTYKWPEC